VDHIVSNGIWDNRPEDIPVEVMSLNAASVCRLDDSKALSVEQFRNEMGGNTVHAIAGIGHPARFFDMLEGMGLKVTSRGFPDHHNYSKSDFDSIPAGSAIIMTHKDAVKCHSLGLQNAWYVPVETGLTDEFEILLKQKLAKLTKDNQ
jgi:tetraacyldisaccharide 4'-kinase